MKEALACREYLGKNDRLDRGSKRLWSCSIPCVLGLRWRREVAKADAFTDVARCW